MCVVLFMFIRSFNSDLTDTKDLSFDSNVFPRELLPPYSMFVSDRGESQVVSPCPLKKKPRFTGNAA